MARNERGARPSAGWRWQRTAAFANDKDVEEIYARLLAGERLLLGGRILTAAPLGTLALLIRRAAEDGYRLGFRPRWDDTDEPVWLAGPLSADDVDPYSSLRPLAKELYARLRRGETPETTRWDVVPYGFFFSPGHDTRYAGFLEPMRPELQREVARLCAPGEVPTCEWTVGDRLRWQLRRSTHGVRWRRPPGAFADDPDVEALYRRLLAGETLPASIPEHAALVRRAAEDGYRLSHHDRSGLFIDGPLRTEDINPRRQLEREACELLAMLIADGEYSQGLGHPEPYGLQFDPRQPSYFEELTRVANELVSPGETIVASWFSDLSVIWHIAKCPPQ